MYLVIILYFSMDLVSITLFRGIIIPVNFAYGNKCLFIPDLWYWLFLGYLTLRLSIVVGFSSGTVGMVLIFILNIYYRKYQ